jgi:hypothetical protein
MDQISWVYFSQPHQINNRCPKYRAEIKYKHSKWTNQRKLGTNTSKTSEFYQRTSLVEWVPHGGRRHIWLATPYTHWYLGPASMIHRQTSYTYSATCNGRRGIHEPWFMIYDGTLSSIWRVGGRVTRVAWLQWATHQVWIDLLHGSTTVRRFSATWEM